MMPTVIVCLPLNIPLPKYRLFQRVNCFRERIDEERGGGTSLVIGWSFVTLQAVATIARAGFAPRWLYEVQFEEGYRLAQLGDSEWLEEDDIVEGLAN